MFWLSCLFYHRIIIIMRRGPGLASVDRNKVAKVSLQKTIVIIIDKFIIDYFSKQDICIAVKLTTVSLSCTFYWALHNGESDKVKTYETQKCVIETLMKPKLFFWKPWKTRLNIYKYNIGILYYFSKVIFIRYNFWSNVFFYWFSNVMQPKGQN